MTTPYQIAAMFTNGGTTLRGRIRFQDGSVDGFEFDLTEFQPAPHRCKNGATISVVAATGQLTVTLAGDDTTPPTGVKAPG